MTEIQVVAGLLVQGPYVLMGKRAPHKLRPELWEYPGGKMEPGESYHEALQRELHEELGVHVMVGERIDVCFLKVEVSFALHLFHVQCSAFDSEKPAQTDLSHSEFRWVEPRHAVQHLPLAPSAYVMYRSVVACMSRLQVVAPVPHPGA